MKYAWVENNKIRDTAIDPASQFTAEVAAFYSTEVADEVQPGWELIEDIWTEPLKPDVIISQPQNSEITVIKFLLKFTPQERISIRSSTDPVVIDWLRILDDPRLTTVEYSIARPTLEYLVSINLLEASRISEILD